MDTKSVEAKRAVHRSPNYPAMTLEKAIAKARVFWQHEKRNPANILVALRHWGYGPVSGGGRALVAALLGFGLLRDEGAGDKRQVRLSEVAIRIILDDRPDSKERTTALREAATTPKIYKEILTLWPGLDVSDANLRHYLLVERGFNENAVKDFIADFRATAAFASLADNHDNRDVAEESPGTDSDILGATPTEVSPAVAPSPQLHTPSPAATPMRPVPPKGVGMRQEVFALAEGDVTIQWPERLSPDSLEDFTDWLRILERKVKRAAQAAVQPPTQSAAESDEL